MNGTVKAAGVLLLLFAFLPFPTQAKSYYYSQASYGLTFTTPVTTLGNVSVSGSIGKGGGSFVIDHPLDPANMLLYHAFVESPEVKNLYDGVAMLDGNGEAVVRLPSYFEALNRDFRYKLSGLDQPAPDAYVKEEIRGNRFIISGGPPNGRISWQVTGIRKDPYIIANPVVPEVEKGEDALLDVGQYVYPEGYGFGEYSPMKWAFQFLSGFRVLFENVVRL